MAAHAAWQAASVVAAGAAESADASMGMKSQERWETLRAASVVNSGKQPSGVAVAWQAEGMGSG